MITHEFFEKDRVRLDDARGSNYGSVEKVWTTGLLTVRWDSGAVEKLSYTEVTKVPTERSGMTD